MGLIADLTQCVCVLPSIPALSIGGLPLGTPVSVRVRHSRRDTWGFAFHTVFPNCGIVRLTPAVPVNIDIRHGSGRMEWGCNLGSGSAKWAGETKDDNIGNTLEKSRWEERQKVRLVSRHRLHRLSPDIPRCPHLLALQLCFVLWQHWFWLKIVQAYYST